MSSSPRNPPWRAEHIGSLLRPDNLVKHRYAVADKSATPESLVPVEQKAIQEVVKLQQDCGIHSITNGEYSRHQCEYVRMQSQENAADVLSLGNLL
jgi:methionine synthase II (cobalamin-independent)